MTTRHQSRLQAAQILYLMWKQQTSADEALSQYAAIEHEASPMAQILVKGVAESLVNIDVKLQEASPNWRLDRMAWVDLAILRMAAFELLIGAIPRAIVIDEAVEVARTFGGEGSPAFVNGVLDHL